MQLFGNVLNFTWQELVMILIGIGAMLVWRIVGLRVEKGLFLC